MRARASSRSAVVSRERSNPFQDFLGPARRRTDHPMVVGTIVISVAIIAVGSVVQIATTFWAGSQVRQLLDEGAAREVRLKSQREAWSKSLEAHSMVLRRMCLNLARDAEAQRECAAPLPSDHPGAGR